MCLAVPGEIITISDDDALMRMARIRFGEVEREVCLTLVPDAGIGDFVLVHAGFAIALICEQEAEKILHDIDTMEL